LRGRGVSVLGDLHELPPAREGDVLRVTTIFGYPLKLTVEVNGKEVDVTSAIRLGPYDRDLVTISTMEILDLTTEAEHQ
jgi:hypothetical protein